MQLVMFEAKQRPEFPHEESCGGAFVNCYIKGRTPKRAYQDAKEWVQESGWEIVKLEDQHEIDRASFEKPEDGLEYYEQALIDGEVFVFHTYPEEEESEHP